MSLEYVFYWPVSYWQAAAAYTIYWRNRVKLFILSHQVPFIIIISAHLTEKHILTVSTVTVVYDCHSTIFLIVKYIFLPLIFLIYAIYNIVYIYIYVVYILKYKQKNRMKSIDFWTKISSSCP